MKPGVARPSLGASGDWSRRRVRSRRQGASTAESDRRIGIRKRLRWERQLSTAAMGTAPVLKEYGYKMGTADPFLGSTDSLLLQVIDLIGS